MNAIWKIAFVVLLAVGGIFVGSLDTRAAGKAYEYTFEKDADTATFNGIKAMNKLIMTFDQDILVLDKTGEGTKDAKDIFDPTQGIMNNPTYIVQKGGTKRINLIKDVTLSGKTLIVTFKNLEFLDYADPTKLEYELVIDKGVLQMDQLEEYRIPFHSYEILPGFTSTFIDTTDSTINNNIFKNNAPRDVNVYVPKMFITGIETIHRYEGVVDAQKGPALTNIDILADEEADRLKVTFDGIANDQYSRDLTYREDVGGFTMGQAGLEALLCEKNVADDPTCTDTNSKVKEFQLKAYNSYGRLLEERAFKVRVADQKTNFKINNYLTQTADGFGQTYTLYELMSDTTLLEGILTHIPVSELNKLAVTYNIGGGLATVADLDQLQMALANPNIKTITFSEPITIKEDVVINREVTIDGATSTFEGNVTIGTGVEDITVRLNNVKKIAGNLEVYLGEKGTVGLNTVDVTGDVILGKGLVNIDAKLNTVTIGGKLTIDVGANGMAMVDDSTAATTTIISGGVNSVYLNKFNATDETKMTPIILENTTPLRVVTSTPIEVIEMNGTGDVTLDGTYKMVKITNATPATPATPATLNTPKAVKLNRPATLTIGELNVAKDVTLTVIGDTGNPFNKTGEGIVIYQSSTGESVPILWTHSKAVSIEASENSVALNMLEGAPDLYSDTYELTNVSWNVVNVNVFGTGTEASYANGILTILGLPTERVSETYDVILQGSNTKGLYKVTVPVVLIN